MAGLEDQQGVAWANDENTCLLGQQHDDDDDSQARPTEMVKDIGLCRDANCRGGKLMQASMGLGVTRSFSDIRRKIPPHVHTRYDATDGCNHALHSCSAPEDVLPQINKMEKATGWSKGEVVK